MLESEKRYANAIARVGPHPRASVRPLQDSLGRLSVFSLGRA
jgi:hypothetical protein